MQTFDVVALGELLIDFTTNGTSAQGNPLLEANPGGAPCNVLALLAKMGRSVAFIGKVGDDAFGTQLENALLETGISTQGLKKDPKIHTTLAVVQTMANGDRDFSFYRNPGADLMLTERELDAAMIQSAKIFHFGSLSLTDEPARSATRKAIALAEEAGVLRSYDPNLREPLWDSLDAAKEQILWGLGHCDILKISDNEIQWLSGEEDFDNAVAWLRKEYPAIQLIFLTLGKDGSRAFYRDVQAREGGFRLNTIETTGAGDTFFGSMLHQLLEQPFGGYTAEDLSRMLRFANAAAALITTRKGALRVMPSREEIEALLKN